MTRVDIDNTIQIWSSLPSYLLALSKRRSMFSFVFGAPSLSVWMKVCQTSHCQDKTSWHYTSQELHCSGSFLPILRLAPKMGFPSPSTTSFNPPLPSQPQKSVAFSFLLSSFFPSCLDISHNLLNQGTWTCTPLNNAHKPRTVYHSTCLLCVYLH